MSNYRRPPAAKGTAQPRRDPLASLKLADMVISKPVLPAEIIERIVDCLSVPDLLRFARVSRRMHEMVYDDTRWQTRLRRMGCWNEAQVAQKIETRKNSVGPAGGRRQTSIDNATVNGKGRPDILVNGIGAHRRKPSQVNSPQKVRMDDGFDSINFGSSVPQQQRPPLGQKEYALVALSSVQPIRGRARQEFSKVYRALAPFYKDALEIPSTTSLIFRSYTLPEQQAHMLVQVRSFARSDFSPGSDKRDSVLQGIADMFNAAALVEFRKGYQYKNIQGQMKQYAHVMHTLDGGQSSIDLFLTDNRLLAEKHKLGTVSDCIDYSMGYGELSLERVQAYFERLGGAYAQETAIIQIAFPTAEEVSLLFLQKVAEEVLAPFLTALFSDARTRSTSMYLRVISGTFAAVKQFLLTYALPPNPDQATILRANEVMIRIYEPHIDLYLDEEFSFFKQKADKEVQQWDQALSAQAESAETFLMSNINRQADKKDFMSSFKKVVMMPVNILPKMSSSSSKSKAPINDEDNLTASSYSRNSTSSPFPRSATPTLPAEAPTTELAAKAAVMATRLEGIKSLFSIEVALNLVHAAKSSLERAAQFVSLGSNIGEQARKQSSAIYVLLLDTVGNRHVKSGFDKAIEHLSAYNPRETRAQNPEHGEKYQQPTVAPLTMFLELVNVGDLIQQMLDVFFESELIANNITQRDDFVSPAVKEKRKFESMLDESVAAGLSKGIDVLIDEVEYICATEQQPSDYNPAFFDANSGVVTTLKAGQNTSTARPVSVAQDVDLSPTAACTHIINLITTHHSMLQGTTDKTLLDVFTSELSHRLFGTLVKHLKRLRVSPTGAIKLLMDLSQYSQFVATFKNAELNRLFEALREVGQIYLFEGTSDKEVREMCEVITDGERYNGVFGVEEVVEFCERRVDWFSVRGKVEGRVRGEGCVVM